METRIYINPRRMKAYGITTAWLTLMEKVNPAAAARALHALAPIRPIYNHGHARHRRKWLGLSARQFRNYTKIYKREFQGAV